MFTFTIINKPQSMKQKHYLLTLLMLMATQMIFAQRVITGTVTSAETKEPLLGVLVSVAGTTSGTTTDVNGKYSLKLPDNAKTLVFTMVGMITKTMPIGSSDVVDFAMQSNEQLLKDVVVTAVAVQREKRSLGYSTTTIKSDDVNSTNDRSALNALQGKVAGVDISSAQGSPGASTRFVIRGGTSLTGNNQALIVVDGMPIDNSSFGFDDVLNNQYDAGNRANDINPQDIDNITVLKGPAATALYGSRASNGAVIITTKSGKGVKGGNNRNFKVSVNTNYTFQNILKYPDMQNEFGQGLYGAPDLRENTNWGLPFDGKVRPWGQQIGDSQLVKPYVGLPNNYKRFFQQGVTYNNNVSIQGSTDKTSFYFSYNNLTNKGIIPTTGYRRNSVKLNVTHEFGDKLTANASLAYTKTQGDLSVQGQGDYSVLFQVLQTPRDISFDEIRDYKSPFNDLNGFYNAYYYNPFYILDNQKTQNNVDRFNGVVNLTYHPLKWLDISGRVGSDNYTDSRFQKLRKFISNNRGNFHQFDGLYSEDIYRVNDINADIMLNGHHTFKHDIGLNVILGQNTRHRDLRNTFARTAGLAIDDFYNLSNSVGRPVANNQSSMRRLVGVYGDVTLSWKNMLFLDLTARNDWSSTLPKNSRSYFYPGVNASWVFSEMIKENDGKWLSFGKVRVGWAQVGNDADPYLLRNVFVSSLVQDGYQNSEVRPPYPSYDPATGEATTVPAFSVSNTLNNPRLKPEITSSWEVGTEMSFFKDRLGIDFTYYQNKSRNQIITIPVAPSSGFTSQVINAGVMQNKGVELAVRATPVKTDWGFKWEIYGTYTRNRNKVLELPGGVDQITLGGLSDMSIVAKVNEPYGSFYAITTQKDPNGNVIVDPITGKPLLNDKPQILGNYQAKYLASWGTRLSYKGLSFNILFNTKQGGLIYSKTKTDMEFTGAGVTTTYNDRKDFVVPNSVIETSPGVYTPNTSLTVSAQDYWTIYKQEDRGAALINASYIKLREISLTYDFPSKLFKNTRSISGLQLSFFGSNLAVWVPKENKYVDPEASSYGNGNAQGFEFGTIPSLRNLGFGLKADF